MSAGFIEAHIERGNRALLGVGVLIVVIFGGLAEVFDHWFPLLFVVAGVLNLALWLRNVVRPDLHPVYKRLARYGDVDEVVAEVNEEFKDAPDGPAPHLGATWLAQRDLYGLHLARWDDVAWLHTDVLRQGSRGDIVGRQVRVWTGDGRSFAVPTGREEAGAEAQAEAQLRVLHARAPWAEVGATEALRREWKHRRPEFLRRVDARKADPAAATA